MMKKTTKTILGIVALCIAASMTTSALAITTLLGADRYLGSSTGVSNNHMSELNALIADHNPINTADPLHATHTSIPTTVAAVTTHHLGNGSAGDVANITFTLQSGHMWLGYKAGTNLGFYYLGGLSVGDEFQVDKGFQQGISNWSTYSGGTRVPDSGATLILLGLGLGALGFIKRRK